MSFTIEGKTRPEGSKPKALRRSGQLPAVLYGHNGIESVSLVVDYKEAETLLRKANSKKPVVELSVPDVWSGKAVIQEIQAHPWRNDLYHLSFFVVKDEATA